MLVILFATTITMYTTLELRFTVQWKGKGRPLTSADCIRSSSTERKERHNDEVKMRWRIWIMRIWIMRALCPFRNVLAFKFVLSYFYLYQVLIVIS